MSGGAFKRQRRAVNEAKAALRQIVLTLGPEPVRGGGCDSCQYEIGRALAIAEGVVGTYEHILNAKQPDYDDTDMTLEEWEDAWKRGTPVTFEEPTDG